MSLIPNELTLGELESDAHRGEWLGERPGKSPATTLLSAGDGELARRTRLEAAIAR